MTVTVFDVFRLFILIRLEKHYPGNIRAFMHHKFIKLQNPLFNLCPMPVNDFLTRQRKTG